jgi:hypothetical protein
MVNITHDDYYSYSSNTTKVWTQDKPETNINGRLCDNWKKRIVDLSDSPRPDYYGGKDNPYEVFNVLEAWELDKDFYLGNVIKYIARAGKKNKSTEKEDLQKALVYLQRRIDSL